MMPDFGRKSEQLSQLQEQLLFSAKRRARGALERNSDQELKACKEVFEAMGRQQEAGEAFSLRLYTAYHAYLIISVYHSYALFLLKQIYIIALYD